MTKRIVATQILRDGKQRGSWHPSNGASRATTTAFNILSLEAYYRYGRLLIAK